MISVIIPVYNEEKVMLKNAVYYSHLSRCSDLIFVDGGSLDDTLVHIPRRARLVHAKKQRAGQMNAGAHVARETILLFMHSDSVIDIASLEIVKNEITRNDCVGGCFSQTYDEPGTVYRWFEWIGNIRAKMTKVFYGDQGLFIRKDVFDSLRGFPDVDIGEDVLFTKMLSGQGKVKVLEERINCSARRWVKQGIWKAFWVYSKTRVAIFWGIKTLKLRNHDLYVR